MVSNTVLLSQSQFHLFAEDEAMSFIGLPVTPESCHKAGERLSFKATYSKDKKPWKESDRITSLTLKLKRSGLRLWRISAGNTINGPNAEDWYDVAVDIPASVPAGIYHLTWCEQGLIFCDDKVETPNFCIANPSAPEQQPQKDVLEPKPIPVN